MLKQKKEPTLSQMLELGKAKFHDGPIGKSEEDIKKGILDESLDLIPGGILLPHNWHLLDLDSQLKWAAIEVVKHNPDMVARGVRRISEERTEKRLKEGYSVGGV